MAQEHSAPLIITRVLDQGRDIRSFDLRPFVADNERAVDFIPGQVAILRVNREEPAYFAFASAPEDRELQILIKRTVGVSSAIFDKRPATVLICWVWLGRVLIWIGSADKTWFSSRWEPASRLCVRRYAMC